MNACDEHIQPTPLAGNAFKERLDLCVVKNDHKLQRNRGRNEACYPFDAEEATGDRRQDATLDRPRRNLSGVQQVIEL